MEKKHVLNVTKISITLYLKINVFYYVLVYPK